ncbi:MAG: reactive intermediate/imine deaminase [Candidatus Aenigmarchaeota archaeon]|nr:reactive intermediate/imine deaminase [Candidatus Aenigmarchaeota archaeon]
MREYVNSPKAPSTKGFPLSHAVLHNLPLTMEISGQIGLDPKTGKLVEGGIEEETRQAIKNIESILSETGWDLRNITKARIFVTDMKEYQKVNEIYAKKFAKDFPARAVIGVKELPLGAHVEIECTAAGEK